MANLDQELERLRAAAGTNAARYQVIEDCRWPACARIAVNVTADFDAKLLRCLLNEPALQLAKGEFGGRVGIWRLLELFASHEIKATVFTPGRICELYPDAVRAIAAGYEVADHMWEHRVPAERALEEEHLAGQAHRLRMLDHFLTDLRSHPGLWNPTGSGLAAHWSSHHPLGELKPSIWQDYPGSLS